MDIKITRRRTSSGPAAIKTSTTLYQPKQNIEPSTSSPKPQEYLAVTAVLAACRSASPMSPSGLDKANTSPATSPQPHRSLTVTIPSTTTIPINQPIFCCTASTTIHMKENSPQDTAYIEAFLDYSHGLPITVSLDFNPHIISVRCVEPTEEPEVEGTYQGTARYFGLSDEGIVISEEVGKPTLGDVRQTVLQYTEIYPTSHLLRPFKQTGLLGLKCNAHGGMWYEVAVLRDSGVQIETGYASDEEEVEESDERDESEELDRAEIDDGTEADAYSGAPESEDKATTATDKVLLNKTFTESTDDAPTDNALPPAGALPSTSSNTNPLPPSTDTSSPATDTAPPTDTSAPSKQKTETQRKNEKRRANEETRKKDNQRRMEQWKKAAAAKKAANAPTGVLNRERGEHVEEVGTETADTEETEYAGGWRVCAVM